ncbi:MAG: hypothetical protein JXA68_09210, partial [Ignavibacteriales bacterium]|nr:hypothetical protein [Ignavibacteriales bacterium]
MKNLLTFLLSVLVIISISASCLNSDEDKEVKKTPKLNLSNVADEEITKEFNVKFGQDFSVTLETGGSIKITGWDKEIVKVTLKFDENNADEYNIDFQEGSNGVSVMVDYMEDDCEDCAVDAEIMVPNKFNVNFETMGGSVSLDNCDGNLEGTTMGGSLDLYKLKGNVDLSTMGGSISLKNSEVDGSVETMGGSVVLENLSGNVDVKTMGGSITQKNVKSKSSEESEGVTISTMGGSIDVDEALNGTNVETMGGSITVNKVYKFLIASTMGGPIEVKELDGWIEASTMGGPIEVNMVGDPNQGDKHVDLSTMGGDVTLIVPAGLSMTFDIELEFDKKHEGDYDIYSDFLLNKETQGKKIYGKGTVGDG